MRRLLIFGKHFSKMKYSCSISGIEHFEYGRAGGVQAADCPPQACGPSAAGHGFPSALKIETAVFIALRRLKRLSDSMLRKVMQKLEGIAFDFFYWDMSYASNLTQRDEARGVGGSNTGTTVLDRGVGNGELSEVVTDHLSLDFDVGEDLSVVNSNDGTDHLGDDDNVTEVGLDGLRALSKVGVDSNL
jgi:hypothetical protein